jgi:hypothetical protein
VGLDKFDCYRKIFNDEADLMTADSREIIILFQLPTNFIHQFLMVKKKNFI